MVNEKYEQRITSLENRLLDLERQNENKRQIISNDLIAVNAIIENIKDISNIRNTLEMQQRLIDRLNQRIDILMIRTSTTKEELEEKSVIIRSKL